MSKKKTHKNGGVVVPQSAMPRRDYPDTYGELWRTVAKLPISVGDPDTDKSLAIDPVHYGATVNALRCALRRAKRNKRVPWDVRVRDGGKLAYLYRG